MKTDDTDYTDPCTCDHVLDEHGGDPEYPGSTACNVTGCDCIAFESAEKGSEP